MIHVQPPEQSVTPAPLLRASKVKSITSKPQGFLSISTLGDKVILGSMKSKVKIFSMSQNKELHTITAYSSKVKAMFVHKNLFFSGQEGEDGIIKVWEMEKYSLVRVLKGHTDTVQMITGYDQHIVVSASNDRTVRVWDINKPEEVVYVLTHEYPVLVVQCVNKDLIVSGGDDCLLILWEWAKEIKLRSIFAHACSVVCLVLKGNELVSAGGDGEVIFWNLEEFIDQNSNQSDEGEKKSHNRVQLSENSVEHCCLFQNGMLFVDDSNKLFMVNGHTSQQIQIDLPYQETVTGIHAFGDQIIVITNQNDAQVFELEPLDGDTFRRQGDETLNGMIQIKL